MAYRMFRKYDDRKGRWLKEAKFYVAAVLVILALLRFCVGFSRVSGHSMEPTLPSGTMVVYSRLHKNYARGDVVSVHMATGEYYIKRVAAVAGDEVNIAEGCLYVNGVKEAGGWASGLTEPQSAAVTYPLTVPEGKYFLVGDNREVSIDSRTFGPVSQSQTRGKIFYAFLKKD